MATLAKVWFMFLLLSCLLQFSALAETPQAFVYRTVTKNKIVIFSKSYCPYCKRAKGIFEQMNEKPFIVELNERDDGADIQKAVTDMVGRRTVPQVFIHGKHIGGSDDTVAAFQSGKLAELLGNKEDLEL